MAASMYCLIRAGGVVGQALSMGDSDRGKWVLRLVVALGLELDNEAKYAMNKLNGVPGVWRTLAHNLTQYSCTKIGRKALHEAALAIEETYPGTIADMLES